MISKKLHFIWLGDEIPPFALNSIENFKLANPTFETNLYHYTIDQVNNAEDFKQSSSVIDRIFWQSVEVAKNDSVYKPFVIKLSDIFRFKIVRHFSGIYLDCDMFPIKPFDDELLSLNRFKATRETSLKNGMIMDEMNFFGISNDTTQQYWNYLFPIMEVSKKTPELQKKFYNGTLQYGEHYGDIHRNYVDHYGRYSWNPKKCIVQKTKYDNASSIIFIYE